jgi:transcriptional regulator with XRE-family HTH domain
MNSLGARLRDQRIRQRVDLRAIAAETKISESLLEALERDDVSRWPSGIFRRAFIRAYAQAIRLNPDEVVREFLERYPDPLENVNTFTAVVAQATGTTGPPRGVTRWLRSSGRTPSINPREAPSIDSRVAEHAQVPHGSAEPLRSAAATAAATEPDLAAVARLCTALGHTSQAEDVQRLLEEASRVMGASGLLLWRWDPGKAVLQPSIGYGYSDAVIAQLPSVTAADDNAVAAAFRGTYIYVVDGGEMTGALAVPLLASGGSVGVLALEFRNGGEQLESVHAVAGILAAQLVHVVPHFQ